MKNSKKRCKFEMGIESLQGKRSTKKKTGIEYNCN